MDDNILHVALGQNVKEYKSILLWALQNSGGKTICVIHVHQPANLIPIMGTRFPASTLTKQEVRAYREIERQNMQKILDGYLLFCRKIGARAESRHIEMDSIEKGIVNLICQLGIRKLVMGAAADMHYSKKMMDLKSKKAIYVRLHSPVSCHIQFLCKGRLIHTSVGSGTDVSSLDGSDDCSTPRRSVAEGSSDGTDNGLELSTLPQYKDSLPCLSPPSVVDGSMDETLYSKLEKAMAEAENARLEAFQETQRRGKAEMDAIEAMHKAQVSDRLCAEELKQRKEIEEALAKEKEEHEKVKIQLSKAMEDLQFALDQKSSLESKIAESNEMVEGLELRIVSAVELLQTYKKERDELLVERDKALKETEELRRKQGNLSSTQMPQFSEFSFSEIEKATQNFNPSLKIGEGRHGNMYKGLLHEIQVSIKVLDNYNSQDPFRSEVDRLNKLRHPNLVTLIGYCQEVQALIYEYIPNGSLEDRLSCKDNTTPLSWQIRVSVATELCSALIFLHSCKPFSVLHGDLTPAKVLLDANFVSKLCDFGSRRLLSHAQSSNNITLRWKTEPKGTSFAYLDPEFLSTGELTLKSDVYSFGITLLQLLTGRPPWGLTKEVQYALDTGKLEDLLDPLAGDWPFEQAKQLAHLALSCSEMYRENRLDLASDVWPVLEPMREDLCGDSSSLQLSSKEHSEPPSYFLCPISQDIMQDPHMATDGFTYEAEVLREWFDSGHDTSPMTNLKLENCNLVANYALHSAIQEWQQKH